MIRIGFVLALLIFFACKSGNDQKVEEEDDGGFNFTTFSSRFQESGLPYQITDTGLLKHNDTASIRNPVFATYIPDSVKAKIFGNATNIKYIPIAKLKGNKKEHFFIVNATGNNKKAALLVVFDKDKNYSATFPFLVPDIDPKSNQYSSLDKSYAVSRVVMRKMSDDVLSEGRDVYSYDASSKRFTLIMTDLLEDNEEVINPIDTFSKGHRFAGDYASDKKNLVSIRAGRNENEILFFIHFERMQGECNGELKGTAFFTSSKTAVFRQPGDPCVLELHFTNNSVRINEVEGCGSYRGIKCVIEGNFQKKKPTTGTTNSERKG
jgi:hypothetical protein